MQRDNQTSAKNQSALAALEALELPTERFQPHVSQVVSPLLFSEKWKQKSSKPITVENEAEKNVIAP